MNTDFSYEGSEYDIEFLNFNQNGANIDKFVPKSYLDIFTLTCSEDNNINIHSEFGEYFISCLS